LNVYWTSIAKPFQHSKIRQLQKDLERSSIKLRFLEEQTKATQKPEQVKSVARPFCSKETNVRNLELSTWSNETLDIFLLLFAVKLAIF
jgi:hypothetical protein